ncbi:MAG: transglycosylase SLT domain-containing protein [Acidobacteriota bacterium]|nr:transglycosylase SLT domain-containing protein [Acidobacteriota bacterium]
MSNYQRRFPAPLLLAILLSVTPLAAVGTQKRPAAHHAASHASAQTKRTTHPRAAKQIPATLKSPTAAQARELETLARRMRDPNKHVASAAFVRLTALNRQWTGPQHDRAALALGYYDYSRGQYAYARTWFRSARRDPVLGRYALYWEGLTADAAGQDDDAVALLGDFLRQYPDSVMKEPALAAFADAAVGVKQPERAIAALHAYSGTSDSAKLLLGLALAEESAGDLSAAARDFETVYYRFPLKDQARDAGKGIDRMRAALGAKFPEAPTADRIARAQALFENRRWRDARVDWAQLRDSVTGVEHDRAALRVAECDAQIHRSTAALESLTLTDPTLDADRWLAIFLVYRAHDDQDGMQAAVAEMTKLAAAGAEAETVNRALFLMGNYYWAHLKRSQAVGYYTLLLGRHPAGEEAATAHWRIAWTAYLQNSPDAAVQIRAQIDNYPDSSYIPDALYWLGNLAERSDNIAAARAYYEKLSSRFVETYFGRLARQRLGRLRAKADAPGVLPVLDRIPPIPPVSPLADDVPASVRSQYERAQALHSIAFDDSAMLEFRTAYQESKAPRLLVDAARAAQDAKHYLTGAALVRLLVPDLESRPLDAVPADIWRIVYPLPYADLIRFYSRHYDIDPMLLASLIRQESGFQPDAVSSAGAIGLAQVEPYTGRKWSHKVHYWYSRRRLMDPRYNLRVGGAYFKALIQQFGSPEAALAAYNAGEDRVNAWLADRHYDDPAEFVESIPFSQTRHYVQVVLNGSVIYRRLYEAH